MKVVKIMADGQVDVHIEGINSYASLCGLDGMDSNKSSRQVTLPCSKGAKITCKPCFDIWSVCKNIKKIDFKV